MLAVNFPFIKCICFEKIDISNDDKLNSRNKHYFLHFLNCRKYRDMNQIQNSYCYFFLNNHILTIKANQQFIQICLQILDKFDNISSINVSFDDTIK